MISPRQVRALSAGDLARFPVIDIWESRHLRPHTRESTQAYCQIMSEGGARDWYPTGVFDDEIGGPRGATNIKMRRSASAY